MFKNAIQSKELRSLIGWIFLLAVIAVFYFPERFDDIIIRYICAGFFWIILIGYFLYRNYVKRNLSHEVIEQEEEEYENQEEQKAKDSLENLVFVIIVVAGIYFTALILKFL